MQEIPAGLRAHADQVTSAAREAAENIAAGHLGMRLAKDEGDEAEAMNIAGKLGQIAFALDPAAAFFVIQALGMMTVEMLIAAHGGIEKLRENMAAGICMCGQPVGHNADHDQMPPDPFQ